MRLESVRIRSLGAHRDITVDLAKLAGPLVAVSGPNGSGKSTLLELALPGALYRSTPTRGTLAELATARDALLESRIVYGEPYTIRHVVDAVSGKGEAAVFDAAGAPVLPDTKVRSFDQWASKRLPSPDVLYAALFSPQGAAGFLGMSKGERKAVLLRTLGCERLELMAERARERVRTTKAALETLDLRIGDVKAQIGASPDIDDAVEHYGAELESARSDAEERASALQLARTALENAEAELRRLEDAERERQAAKARRAELTDHRDQALSTLSGLDGRIASDRAVLAERVAIQAAVARAAALRNSIAELEQAERDRKAAAEESERVSSAIAAEMNKLADLEVRIANNRGVQAEAAAINAAVARAGELRERIAKLDLTVAAKRAEDGRLSTEGIAAERARTAATGRADALRTRLQNAGVELPEGALETARAEVTTHAEALAYAEAELERLRGQRVAGAEDRIQALRGGLGEIAGGAKGAAKVARATLDQDDAATKVAAELPAATHAAESVVEAARRLKLEASDHLTECERRAAHHANLAAARADLEVAEREAAEATALAEAAAKARALVLSEADKREQDTQALRVELAALAPLLGKAEPLARAEARLAELEPQLDAARAAAKRLTDELAALPAPSDSHQPAIDAARDELAALEPTAAKASLLATATVRLAELEPQADAARAELSRLDAALAALPPPTDAVPMPYLGPLEQAVEQAEAADRQAHTALTIAEQRLSTARELQGRLDGFRAERAVLDRDLADWTKLAADFGRDGLQAAEIDAAGPELTELVNELLHSCVGPRFTMAVETTKLSADGKRQLEGCEVRVIDTVRGREAEASTFSGGEKVVLGEALSLALTMLACRRAGLSGVTLVRDESGAALDPENARAYIAMWRRAVEIVRADKLLFVSHVPEIIELADDRIEIPGPTAAPSAEAAE